MALTFTRGARIALASVFVALAAATIPAHATAEAVLQDTSLESGWSNGTDISARYDRPLDASSTASVVDLAGNPVAGSATVQNSKYGTMDTIAWTALAPRQGVYSITFAADAEGLGDPSAPVSRTFSIDLRRPAAPALSAPTNNQIVMPGETLTFAGAMRDEKVASGSAHTELAADLTSVATTVTVADASDFPAPPFVIAVDEERILVGAVGGNDFISLTRGYAGTPVGAHNGVLVTNPDSSTYTDWPAVDYLDDSASLVSHADEVRVEIYKPRAPEKPNLNNLSGIALVVEADGTTCDASCPAGAEKAFSVSPALSPGYYTAKVFAVDVAGNSSAPTQVSFVVL